MNTKITKIATRLGSGFSNAAKVKVSRGFFSPMDLDQLKLGQSQC
jgi:hypothetical protein